MLGLAAVTAARAQAAISGRMLRLQPGQARRNGVRWQPLRLLHRRARVAALGMVLSAEPLVTLRERYVAAVARWQQDRASLEYARQEHRRLRRLYHQHQNVSLKALQAAALQVTHWRSAAGADRAQWGLIVAEATQGWGPKVAGWLAASRQGAPAPNLARVLQLQEYLIELTPPAGARPPRRARFQPPGGGAPIVGQYLSAYPQINPRLQAPGYLYLAPARAALAPGLSLTASLRAGRVQAGVLAPRAALLYWRGEPWIFLRLGPGRFQLHQVHAAFSSRAGAYIPERALAGREIVTTGAQQLFSQLLRRQAGPATPSGGR